MKTQHTPGPWIAHGLTICTASKLPNQVIPRDPVCREIGSASWNDDEDDDGVTWDYEEAEANARLIAAAPELLEALQMVDRIWASNSQPADDSPIARVRAAIAKATGEGA